MEPDFAVSWQKLASRVAKIEKELTGPGSTGLPRSGRSCIRPEALQRCFWVCGPQTEPLRIE